MARIIIHILILLYQLSSFAYYLSAILPARLPVYPPLEGLWRAFGETKDPIRNLFIEGFFSRYSLLQNDEETTLVILFGICSSRHPETKLIERSNFLLCNYNILVMTQKLNFGRIKSVTRE